MKYSGSREGRGIQYCVGGTQVGEEIPAAPAGTAPHTLGPFIGVYVVGQRQRTGCHDSLTRMMVGAPGQVVVPGSQLGTRMDGRMDKWVDEFHKSKRAIPNGVLLIRRCPRCGE